MRRTFDLPPFTHIAVLTIRSQHESMAEFATQTLAARLRGMLPPPATMTEPMPAPSPVRTDSSDSRLRSRGHPPASSPALSGNWCRKPAWGKT